MDGTLQLRGCTIYDLLDVLVANVMGGARNAYLEWRSKLSLMSRRLAQHNPATRSRTNVAHHYDLNGRLYSLFLDRDRQYSCAYQQHPIFRPERACEAFAVKAVLIADGG